MQTEPVHSPLRMEQYKTTDNVTLNRSSGFTIQNLITEQLNRIDYMKTIPLITKEISELKIIASTKYALRSIESKLSPFLEKDYYETTNPIKEKLKKIDNIDQAMDTLSQWEDALIGRLGLIELLPQGSKEMEFD